MKVWSAASAVVVCAALLMAFTAASGQAVPTQPQPNGAPSSGATAVPRLQQPAGTFAIGRIGYEWIDSSRPDGHAAGPSAHRDLMVYLWYPAAKTLAAVPGPYIPGAKQIDADPAAAPAMRDELESAWPLIVSGAVSSLALENAPVAPSPKKFPVVLLAHGTGGTTFEYTSLIATLVSRGYVVAAIENTYLAPAVAFPDGRIVSAFHEPMPPNLPPDQRFQRMMKSAGEAIDTGARDIVFVLDQLTTLDQPTAQQSQPAFTLRNRLDLARVAAMGHSAGGANATLACQMDPRFKACISLDGEMPPAAAFPESSEGKWFTQPVLLLEVDHNGRWMGFSPALNDAFLKKKEEQLNRCPAGSYDIILKSPGLTHGSFSDYPLLTASNPAETNAALHNLDLIESYTEAFLNQALNHVDSPLLQQSATHPEAVVKRYGR